MDPMLMNVMFGAAGGAAGAGIAWLIGRAMGRRPAWLALAPAVGIGIAIAVSRSLQPSFGDELVARLDELPTVRALRAHYPADYRDLESKIRGLPDGAKPADVERTTAEAFASVLQRQLPKADAEHMYALHRVIRDYAGALRTTDPAACVRVTEGTASPMSFAAARSPDLVRRDMEATAQILIQSATRPSAAPAPMSFDELLRFSSAAMATLPDRDQDLAIAVLQSERDPQTAEEARVMCAFNLALSDRFLALPPAEGGAKIRAMLAME